MTPNELTKKFNDEFGVNKMWPVKYEVDAETYALCCNEVFKLTVEIDGWFGFHRKVVVAIGKNDGLMFKNVELILRKL